MKCTECSSTVRPIVAVDIDGTLAQYHRHFLNFADAFFDLEFSREFDGSIEMHEFMNLTLDDYRKCKLAFRQGGMKRSIPLYPGAEAFMWWLNSSGNCEVWITTTRPYQRLDAVDPDTQFWLDRHGIHYNHLLYHEDKYRILGENVDSDRVVAIVDDLPSQCEAAQKWFSDEVPIMPVRRHNSFCTQSIMRFESFPMLKEIIETRIGEWCGHHGA